MSTSDSCDYTLIDRLAEEFAARYRNGERPSVQEYCLLYPHIADDLRTLLPALAEVEQVKDEVQVPPPIEDRKLRHVGEYQILREVGRGGMGVVYEAEQVSLGRRVALKVLAGAKTGHGLERFKREARAAARLHHTNIVPIFGVGDHEGMPYYVMQFIQGLGLDEVLEEVKHLQAMSGAAVPPSAVSANPSRRDISAGAVARSLVTGTFQPPPQGFSETETWKARASEMGVGLQDTTNLAGPDIGRADSPGSATSISLPGQTSLAGKKFTYWQSVAQIGLQVAEALDYAHNQGVLHRDIKPSNLLLDLHGVVWVTDFGLAKSDDQENLTHTGDVLGTIRYMPPEAFDGKSDARSDVYSLGLSLYEFLALRPAFSERNREQLVKQVTTTDPPRLGSVNKLIPRDLQTIVHKAIEKNPSHRYQSASELAADLRRFVDDRPIQARSISSAERAWRWCRRNPLVANLAAAVVFLLVSGTSLATYFAIRATAVAREAEDHARKALLEKDRADAKAKEAEEQAHQTLLERERTHAKAKEAEANAEDARTNHYVVRINSVQMALENGNVPLARGFLEQLRNLGDRQKRPLGWEWNYNWRLCNREIRVMRGHTDDVGEVAFSEDGSRFASTSDDRTLRIWETATGRQLSSFPVNSTWATCIAFSPDGTCLAVASDGNAVTILDATSGQALHRYQGHTKMVRGVAFSRDGSRLYTASEDRTVKVWGVESREQLHSFLHPSGYLRCVAVSPDGKLLALGGSDSPLLIRDAGTGQIIRTLPGHTGGIYCLAFSPNGRRLASGGKDRLAKIWDLTSGREQLTLTGHTGDVNTLCFHPDGTRLATGSDDHTIRVWDAYSGQQAEPFLGHTEQVESIAFSPDGRNLLSGGTDNTIRLWTFGQQTGPRVFKAHENQVRAVGFSVDGKHLISAGQDGKIQVRDPITGQEQASFPGAPTGYLGLAISPDARHLAAAGNLGLVELWDLTTRRIVWKMKGHPSWLSALAFSPDGQWLASGGDGDRSNKKAPITIKLWKVATGEEVRAFPGHTEEVKSLVFSPDGTQLISGSGDDTIRVWEVATGIERKTLRGKSGGVNSIALHPDGNLLAAACSDHSVRLWDLQSRQEVRPFLGHFENVWSVAFSPDGTRLASASWDQTVRIWHTASGLELAILRGHPDRVLGVAFSPDGHLLASAGGKDQTVRLWDARPVTAESSVELEAVGLLDYLFALPMTKVDVIAAVQHNKTITEGTRQKALELAERYKEETDPKKYAAAAWQIVRHPYSNTILRRYALAQAQIACRQDQKNPSYACTLGVAQYRLGLFQEALPTLRRAESLVPAISKERLNLKIMALLAMTLHRLDQKEKALTTLAQLQAITKQPGWVVDEEVNELMSEAEGLTMRKDGT